MSEISCSDYTVKYIRYANVLGLMNRFLPLRFQTKLASMVSQALSPDRLLDHKITDNFEKVEFEGKESWNDEALLKKFHQHACIGGLDHVAFRRKTPSWLANRVVFEGLDQLQHSYESSPGGALVLTYHNHYKFLLPVTFGLLGYDTSALAIDYRLSEVYQCPEGARIYENFFGEIESYFNNGEFIYITGRDPIKTFKRVSKAIGPRRILISLNDVYSPLAGTRHCRTKFLGRDLICPTGTIEKALQLGSDIYSAYIKWDFEAQKYQVVTKKLNAQEGVQSVVDQYMEAFAPAVSKDPALWEGWKLL